MFSQYEPLTTAKQASVQTGLTVPELKKVVETSHRGSNTLYVNNLSLAAHIELNGGQVERYEEAIAKAILKAKVEAVILEAKSYVKSEEKKLSENMLNLYNTERAENKQSIENMISDILHSLENSSDTEYKALIKKSIGSIVDIQKLRDINDQKKPDVIVMDLGGYSSRDLEIWIEIIEKYNKSQNVVRKLVKKFHFTEKTLEKYCEKDTDLSAVVNDEGQLYNFIVQGYEQYMKFFKNYKSIKEDYNTKIDYPLDKSVIADIEAKYRKKFHIDLDKWSK